MLNQRKPTHPEEVFLEDFIKPLRITITDGAKNLGISRKALSEFVNCRSSLSLGMAVRISEATNTSPESWLNMQTKRNLWIALQNKPEGILQFQKD